MTKAREVTATAYNENKLRWVADVLLFALSRAAGIHVSWHEVRSRAYASDSQALPSVNKEQAEFLFKLEREDSAYTDANVKQLLTLSSTLATFIFLFASSVAWRPAVVVLIALLVACVYLCISILEVRTSTLPTLGTSAATDTWSGDVAQSIRANRSRHSFRVDRYRAAGRYFLAALFLTPIVAGFTLRSDETEGRRRTEASIERAAMALERLELRVDSLAKTGILFRQTAPFVVKPADDARWQTRGERESRPGRQTQEKIPATTNP